MGFFKDCEGLLLFLSVYVIFILQILLIVYVDDKENPEGNIILTLHKIIFYIIMFLTFYSHLQTGVTDPGSIDYYNNLDIIEFYYFVYKDINIIKENINNNLFKLKNEEEENEEDEYNPYSDEDNTKFENKSSIDTKLRKEIRKQLHLETSRCYNCHAVRPMNVHHCNVCHSCIIDRDHHCPWINNCVGIFNKKYFILFNMYAFISVIYASFIFYYYTAFKNYKRFRNDIVKFLIGFFWALFAVIYGIFVAILVFEQRDNVLREFKMYDKNKEIKKILMGLKMRIIFGGDFSFKWFMPFYEGGQRHLYFFIRKKKLELYQKSKQAKNKEIKNDNEEIEKINEEKEKNE